MDFSLIMPVKPAFAVSPRRVITSFHATPKESIEGKPVAHSAVVGYVAMCRMVQRREWVKRGVGEESPWDKQEYEEWVKGWRMTLMHSFLFDKETQDLAEFRPKGMSIPPADEFIRIDGAVIHQT